MPLNQSRIVARGIDAPEIAEVSGVDDLAGFRVDAQWGTALKLLTGFAKLTLLKSLENSAPNSTLSIHTDKGRLLM